METQVQNLHGRQAHTLQIHQETYFFQDLETFLTNATQTQLQGYIDHYSPVITESIKRALTQPDEPIQEPPTITTTTTNNDHTLHHALEEAQHRKRNRRRAPTAVINPITKYFGPRNS